eukprot:c26972_g1_i1 orf=627-1829(-)
MGRARIPITWIKSDASRQVTFTKRKKGLKKKVEELAILCGVEACMICYGPGKPSNIPFTWGFPGVRHVINKYNSLSKQEQDKKKLDNTTLLEQQIKKLRVELRLKVEQNRDLESENAYFTGDDHLNSHGIDGLEELADIVREKVRLAYDQISYLAAYQGNCPTIRALDQENQGSNGNPPEHPFEEYEPFSSCSFLSQELPSQNFPQQLASSLPVVTQNPGSSLWMHPFPLMNLSMPEQYEAVDPNTGNLSLSQKGSLPGGIASSFLPVFGESVPFQSDPSTIQTIGKLTVPELDPHHYLSSSSWRQEGVGVQGAYTDFPSYNPPSSEELKFQVVEQLSSYPQHWSEDVILGPQGNIVQQVDMVLKNELEHDGAIEICNGNSDGQVQDDSFTHQPEMAYQL